MSKTRDGECPECKGTCAYCGFCGAPLEELARLREQVKVMREALEVCLPVVEEAYWDQHTAGMMPGSGYCNKAQNLAGLTWGWRDSRRFSDWFKGIKEALRRAGETEEK